MLIKHYGDKMSVDQISVAKMSVGQMSFGQMEEHGRTWKNIFPGNPTEGEGSVSLTSLYLLFQTSCFLSEQ
jgi:hypothetical protein